MHVWLCIYGYVCTFICLYKNEYLIASNESPLVVINFASRILVEQNEKTIVKLEKRKYHREVIPESFCSTLETKEKVRRAFRS